METLLQLHYELSTLTVYRSLREEPVVKAFYELSNLLNDSPAKNRLERLLENYSFICSALFSSESAGNLYDFLYDAVQYDYNIFAAECSNGNFTALSAEMKNACRYDLSTLFRLATVPAAALKKEIALLYPSHNRLVEVLPEYLTVPGRHECFGNWGEHLERFAAFHQSRGVSIFAKYYAFHYSSSFGLEPVAKFDGIRLSELKHYETQRQKVIDNTRGFLQGKPFNNVLLYGDRGTGKSSTVKALFNEYKDQGLRIVELPKQELTNLDKVIHLIEDVPLKFILFIDDLVFNENDPSFGILKALLEGSLVRRPDNIAVYATTNRRHLVKETFSGREGDEVHRADTIDEALSLSDRFGLHVTFTLPDKFKFLDIVRLLAADRGIEIDEDTLFRGAEQFAIRKSGRTPRLAKQYVDYIEARQSMSLPLL